MTPEIWALIGKLGLWGFGVFVKDQAQRQALADNFQSFINERKSTEAETVELKESLDSQDDELNNKQLNRPAAP